MAIEKNSREWNDLVNKIGQAVEWDFFDLNDLYLECLTDINFHSQRKQIEPFLRKIESGLDGQESQMGESVSFRSASLKENYKRLNRAAKSRLIESSEIENVAQLYRKYGKTHPYAADAIAYYIFGNKSDGNILIKAYNGAYGRGSEIDPSEVSDYMLDYEYSWEEHIEDIDDHIKNLSTSDGSTLSDYY